MSNKQEQRKAKIRQSIMEAALKIADQQGWGGVTIRKIADEILYTPPIVYEHFKNKDDLYRQLVKEGFDELTSSTLAAVREKSTPEEKLITMAEVRFDFSTRHHTLHHLMFDADNPEWQKSQIIKSMSSIKALVYDWLAKLSGKPEMVQEYFMNLIILVKGYTYFNNRMMRSVMMKTALIPEDTDMKEMFLNAIKRFIESIKSDHE